jgi:hypothetical protein
MILRREVDLNALPLFIYALGNDRLPAAGSQVPASISRAISATS